MNYNITVSFVTFFKNYIENFLSLPKESRIGILLSFIESSLSGICFFLSLYFVKVLQINISLAGLIISCYALGTAFGGLAGGKFSDNTDPKLIAGISLAVEGAAFLALIVFSNPYFLMLNLFILGMAIYGFLIANNVWVIQQCNKDENTKLQAINFLYIASNCGFGIAALIIILLTPHSFQYVFLLSGICLLTSSFTLLLHKTKKSQILCSQNITKIDPDNTFEKNQNNKKIIILVLSCLFLVGLIISQRSAVYLIYIHNLFPNSGMLGTALVFVLNPLLIVLLQTSIISYFKNSNKLLVIGVGASLMGLGMYMLEFSFVFPLLILACVIYTIGEILFFAMAQFVCYQKSDTNKKGSGLGIFKTVYAISIIIGPVLAGYIYHHLGSSFLWILDGIFGLLCFLSCNYFKKYI